jgi:hypothetical protein
MREISRRDLRFLVFVAVLLVALAVGGNADVFGRWQTWLLGAALLVVAVPAVFGYLSDKGPPSLEHLVPSVLGATAVSGFAALLPPWWQYCLIALAFGACYLLAGQLDYFQLLDQQKPIHLLVQESLLALGLASSYLVILASGVALPVRLVGIFGTSALAAYRSFRLFGRPMSTRRALLFSLLVAQLVTFFGWAMSVYVYFTEGVFAILLFLIWYVNRGIIRHTAEESLTRYAVIEYSVFVVLIVYLFSTSFQPR